MSVHIKAFGVFDAPKIDNFTTSSNSYVDVPIHWPDNTSDERTYWPIDKLGGKRIRFSASTNNLLVQILASLDGGATFPIIAEAEFSVDVGSPVLKDIGEYYHALKIQVKPAVASVHGTLVVQAGGSSLPSVSDIAITALGAGSSIIGKVGIDQATAHANEVVVTTLAAPATLPLPTGAATSALQTAGNASLAAIAAEKVQLHANIDFSSASAQTIIAAPAAGNRIRLCQLLLMSGATSPVNSEVAIKSGSTTIKTVKGTTVVLDFPEHCNLGTAEALVLQATTADRIIGGVDYYVEAV